MDNKDNIEKYKFLFDKLDRLQLNLELLKQLVVLYQKYDEVLEDDTEDRVKEFVNRYAN